ncbi:MAG TPA: VOC family protein, partial [Thermoleophilaceae bacterium]|nr:VOC family protein [Thermoleophilaceae bacterium]
PALAVNHVSVSAADIDESARFYRELFAMEPIPTPNFGFPVQWLRVGPNQLHLFMRPDAAPAYHHVAFTVDDFDDVYQRAARRGAFDRTTFGHHLYELPGDVAQLYLRDPAGNLVEVDAPDAGRLAESTRGDMRALADMLPQSAENLRGTLFHDAARQLLATR